MSEVALPLVRLEMECQVRRELTMLAAGLDTLFLDAGTTLSEAVSMIDRIIERLDSVVAALDERAAGAAVTDLLGVASMLTMLPEAQSERRGRMADVAGTASQLRSHVLDMHQTLRVLSIYGMNIKIAASGERQFVGFVDGMNGKIAAGERQLAGVLATLKDLDAGLATVQQVDRLLTAECMKVVPDVPRRLALNAGELDAHLKVVADLARRVSTIARDVQGKVAVLLGALQVGDSTRQRLEHVVSALHLAEAQGCGTAAMSHVDLLVAAQLEAIGRDFASETASLIASLRGLAPDARGLGVLIGEQAGSDGHAFLTRLEDSVSDIERVMIQLRSAQKQAREMTALTACTVTDLTERVRQLSRVRLDVQDIATNTRLLCRRHGNIGRAVAVVAAEVDAHASRMGSITNMVADTLDRLGNIEIAPAAEGRSVGEVDDPIGSALGIIRQACRQTEGVVLEGGDDMWRLAELLQNTAARFSEEMRIAGAITDAAAALTGRGSGVSPASAAVRDEGALRRLLTEIAGLYTMARERDVHARFLLPGMESADPAGLPEDDDGLF